MINTKSLCVALVLILLSKNSICRVTSAEEILNNLASKPLMSDKEFHLLYKYANTANVILEFGTGGTSFLFSSMNKTVYSFDTDQDYINNIKSHHLIKDRLGIKHFFFYCDVGRVGPYGTPINPEDYNFFSSVGKYLLTINLKNVDLFFIDGRYRVESGLSLLVNSKENAIFIVHDFLNRDYYNTLLEYFFIIESVDSLVVLKKKENYDLIKLQADLVKYQQDYR